MFRKIVTELAYSPALAGNLGYYVKQLRNETSRRQIGLIFVFLAITVQLFVAIAPPESANASNPAALVDGDVQSIGDYLTYYDDNTGNIRDLLDSLGVTRSEIQAAQLQELPSADESFFWLMQNNRSDSSAAHFFTTTSTKPGVAYYEPLASRSVDSSVYVGSSSRLGGWFAITKNGASLITEKKAATGCKNWLTSPGTPLKVDTWSNSSYEADCLSMFSLSLSIRKISPDSSNMNLLHASDRTAYTLSVENKGSEPASLTPAINLEDVLEYSRILDYGGGEYNFDTKNLSWPTTTIDAKGSIDRTFITQVLPTIPATAQGQFVKHSYDCNVTLSFGTTLSTPVNCPLAKHIERTTNSFPLLPPNVNIIGPICLVVITLFLYIRSRQLLSELYIIRHNHLGGL